MPRQKNKNAPKDSRGFIMLIRRAPHKRKSGPLGAGRAVDGNELFAQPAIVQEEMDLRGECAGPRHLKHALQLFRRAGGYLEGDGTLQTEAAIAASAKRTADHAHRMARRIVQPKRGDILADGQARKRALRFLERRAGAVGVQIISVPGHAEENEGDQEKNVGENAARHLGFLVDMT